MKPEEFWQNFQLGIEHEIACNFIYDGVRNLHEMKTLSLESEVFSFFYNTSVGFERLLKVAVALLEYEDGADTEELEESLRTHNHLELLKRLRQKSSINLGDCHIEFLALLSKFYKTH